MVLQVSTFLLFLALSIAIAQVSNNHRTLFACLVEGSPLLRGNKILSLCCGQQVEEEEHFATGGDLKKRERERERNRDAHRERQRQRLRETETETERETERIEIHTERQAHTNTDADRVMIIETEKQRQRYEIERHRQTETDRQTYRHRHRQTQNRRTDRHLENPSNLPETTSPTHTPSVSIAATYRSHLATAANVDPWRLRVFPHLVC